MAQRRCIGARCVDWVFGSAVGVRAGRTFGNLLSRWTSPSPLTQSSLSSCSSTPSRGGALGAAVAGVCFENLEDRRMLSSVTFDSGVLIVRGDTGSANNITVDLNSDGSRVVATIAGGD